MKPGPEHGSGGFRPDNGAHMPQSPRGPAMPETSLPGFPARPQRPSRMQNAEVGQTPGADQTEISLPQVRAARGAGDVPSRDSDAVSGEVRPAVQGDTSHSFGEPVQGDGKSTSSNPEPQQTPSPSDAPVSPQQPGGGARTNPRQSEGEVPSAEHPSDPRPRVELVPSGFLVGVKHDATLTTPLKEGDITPDYQRVLEQTDHIVLEGYESSYTLYEDKDLNYERLAHNTVLVKKGPEAVHYLEQGVSREKLLADAGVPPLEVGLYGIYRALATDLPREAWSTPKVAQANMDRIVEGLRRREFYGNMPPEEVERLLWTGMRTMGGNEPLVTVGFTTILPYDLRVRDAHVLGPVAVRHARELPGTKAFFVGKEHMGALRDSLNGKLPAAPPPWQEYVKGLDAQARAGLDYLSATARMD